MQSVWIKCCKDAAIAPQVQVCLESKLGCWHEVIICGIRGEKKLKNLVGKIFADMPRDWITFLAKTHFGSLSSVGVFVFQAAIITFFFGGGGCQNIPLSLDWISLPYIPSTFLILLLHLRVFELLSSSFLKKRLNVAEREEECLLQLLVTAGYKSWRHSSLRSGHRSVRAREPRRLTPDSRQDPCMQRGVRCVQRFTGSIISKLDFVTVCRVFKDCESLSFGMRNDCFTSNALALF